MTSGVVDEQILSMASTSEASSERESVTMGTGSCKLCSCLYFVPSGGWSVCGNQNSVGGTCNHYDWEHD